MVSRHQKRLLPLASIGFFKAKTREWTRQYPGALRARTSPGAGRMTEIGNILDVRKTRHGPFPIDLEDDSGGLSDINYHGATLALAVAVVVYVLAGGARLLLH